MKSPPGFAIDRAAGIAGRVLLVVALSAQAAGCSLFAPADDTTGRHARAWFGETDKSAVSSRASASFESAVGLFGKSVVIDPLVRPYSTAKAFYGHTIKTAGGLLERAFISRVRRPKLEREPIPPLAAAGTMDLVAWERELDDLVAGEPSSGRLRLLVDGEEYFNRLDEAIESAGRSIDIRTYIFDNDDFALEFGEKLRRRAREVDVRILTDGLADIVATRRDSASMPKDVVLPASMSRHLSGGNPLQFRKQSNPALTSDHAKITLIDSEVAFVGGMNIGREYRYDWHDLMLEVRGSMVDRLQTEFDRTWARAGIFGDFAWFARSLRRSTPRDTSGSYPIRMLKTSIHNSELYRAQIAAIRRAQGYIYIQNAYFSDDKILFELMRARRRGVDVRVILSSRNDSAILHLSNQTAINAMLRNGIRVYAYPGMTHVKAAVYDGWACVGSANFDKLSLQVNHEINLGTSHPEFVEQLLERVFARDFAVSTELREARPVGGRHRIAEFLADELL